MPKKKELLHWVLLVAAVVTATWIFQLKQHTAAHAIKIVNSSPSCLVYRCPHDMGVVMIHDMRTDFNPPVVNQSYIGTYQSEYRI
jgi:hypothetical protein